MKKWWMLLASALLAFQAHAVDVNKASQAELEAAKGIGPAKAKAIIDERNKGGAFKSWDDLDARVKGVGEKTSENMKKAGLTIAGGAGAAPAAKAEPKKDVAPKAEPAKTEAPKAAARKEEKKEDKKAEPKKDGAKPESKKDDKKSEAKKEEKKDAKK